MVDLDQKVRSQTQAQVMANVVLVILVAVSVWAMSHMMTWAFEHVRSKSAVTDTAEITAQIRERQLTCLSQNIYKEAGGEPFEGKVAVAQVTINRAEARGFPDDVCAVVYEKTRMVDRVFCQFSWVCEGPSKFRALNTREFKESQEVAKKVLLEGFRLPSLVGALYFHGDYINPGWKRTKVAHIGRHIFYR